MLMLINHQKTIRIDKIAAKFHIFFSSIFKYTFRIQVLNNTKNSLFVNQINILKLGNAKHCFSKLLVAINSTLKINLTSNW
jgi:hypothetical protein